MITFVVIKYAICDYAWLLKYVIYIAMSYLSKVIFVVLVTNIIIATS
jgi:hypothetical protein